MNVLDDVPLSDNFIAGEFACPGEMEGRPCACHGAILVHPSLVECLQLLREDVWKRPMYLNCGFRCDKYNEAIGGWSASLHRKGMAADILVAGKTNLLSIGADEVDRYIDLGQRMVNAIEDDTGDSQYSRCIVYPLRGFIHLDIGEYSSNRVTVNWSKPRSRRGY